MMKRALLVLFLVLPAAGCGDFLVPPPALSRADAEITIVRVAANAPPLTATEVSFWAVRGQDREVEIRYENGGYSGKCMRFVVPAQAPLRHANGAPVQVGDSVLVTVRVLDPRLFLFEFDPGGLIFDPAHPARLEIRYRWLAEDTNGDGVVDQRDEQLARNFGLWRQEKVGAAWSPIPALRLGAEMEIHADITGFTRYALASD
jgi:hypothetical protein